MNGSLPAFKDIFDAARLLPADERRPYLERACGGDAGLQRRVEDLLRALDEAGSFLESPTFSSAHAVHSSSTEATPGLSPGAPATGATIGRYRLLQLIGEGGFGSVYMAEQLEPVSRKVALKITKVGMDTRQVVARFEAERQALAMMDHPNIAKVLDAGATPDGRPYFVMELVRGDPITDYCDRERLSVPDRLELFTQVCQAVQHAHQKGIIHRDIKPSNVLVTIADGRPVPKVIDFGIAKATGGGARLTEKTLFTEFRQLIGTPQYMSPEQAEAAGVDIDTRSDIYSLGVLLYELLTGTTPFDAARLRSAALGEIQRIIREEEPPKPSTRLSTLQTLATVAEHRRAEPRRLGVMIRGDLDWIVMKCLEKDRARRYETAESLALDVQRHLQNEPVQAGPPGAVYKIRKFVRRNKVGVSAAAAIMMVLVLGILGTSLGLSWALRERAEAVAAREAEAKQRRLAEANARRAQEEAERAERETQRAVAAEAAEKRRADELETMSRFQAHQISNIDVAGMGQRLRQQLIHARYGCAEREGHDTAQATQVLQEFTESLDDINFTDLALDALDTFIFVRTLNTIDDNLGDQPLLKARFLHTLAGSMIDLGLLEGARKPLEEAVETYRHAMGAEHPDCIAAMISLANLQRVQGHLHEAETMYRRCLEVSQGSCGSNHSDTLTIMSDLGLVLQSLGRYSEAEGLWLNVLEGYLRRFGPDDERTLTALNNLGSVFHLQGRLGEAEQYLRQGLDGCVRVLGKDHPDTLNSLSNLGYLLWTDNRHAEAEPYWIEALAGFRRVLGNRHPSTLIALGNLGALMSSMGRYVDAERYLEEAWNNAKVVLGDHHHETLSMMNNVAYIRKTQGRFKEARELFTMLLEARRSSLGPDHPDTINTIGNIGGTYEDEGRLTEAEPLFRHALSAWRQRHGDSHPETLRHLRNLARLLEKLGRLDEAEPLLAEVVTIAKRIRPTSDSRTASELFRHARVLQEMARFAEAQRLAVEAYEICNLTDGQNHEHTQIVVAQLVSLYEAWHAADPEHGYDQEALAWRRRLSPRE